MRTLRNVLNPVSTAVSRWWCHSSPRALASGKPWNYYRRRGRPLAGPARSALMDPQVRQARIEAIERILGPGGE
jgi:hypothetical protein